MQSEQTPTKEKEPSNIYEEKVAEFLSNFENGYPGKSCVKELIQYVIESHLNKKELEEFWFQYTMGYSHFLGKHGINRYSKSGLLITRINKFFSGLSKSFDVDKIVDDLYD